MIKFSLPKILFTLTALSLLVVPFSTTVKAEIESLGYVYNSNGYVYQKYMSHSFNDYYYASTNPATDGLWYNVVSSIPPIRFENVPCGGIGIPDASCAQILTEGNDSFVQLSMKPDPTGYTPFYFTQIQDSQEALSASVTKPWMPTNGGEVVMTARVRYSDNYTQDATGAAVGTSSIGFWNNPAYLTEDPNNPLGLNPIESVWFSWVDGYTAFDPNYNGLHVGSFSQDTPFGYPAAPDQFELIRNSNFDMNDWHTLRIVWSADANGNQHAKFQIFQESTLTYIEKNMDLERPIGPLSFLAGNDATAAIQVPEGYVVPIVNPPTEKQDMDIDYVRVHQSY